MNRAERRRREREVKKNLKTINALTPAQVKMIDIAAEERSKKHIDEFTSILDRNMTSALMDKGWTFEEVENIQDEIANLMMEDVEKINKLKKENIDMAKQEKEVREYIKKLIDKKLDKKEILKELEFKFPMLSKSMLNVAYTKIKEEFKKENKEVLTREAIIESAKKHGLDTEGKKKIAQELGSTYSTIATYISRWKITEKEIIDKKEIDEAAEEIVNIINEPVVAENATTEEKQNNKTNNSINKANKTIEKENKEEFKMEGLRILSMVLQGENGVYKVCENGVELTNEGMMISFKNIEELNKFTEEFREVFGKMK